jgi:hypothetical protein
MKSINSSQGGTMRLMAGRFAGEAWEEFKAGIDKAWDEIKMSIDESIKTTSAGLTRGWSEISFGANKAKDSLLRTKSDGSVSSRRAKTRKKKDQVT